jgi:hypothetical protein
MEPVSSGHTVTVNKRNPHKDLLPFMVGQSHDRPTLLRVAAVKYFNCILACHSLTDTNTLLDTQVCFRVALVSALCTALELLADNAEITSPPLSSVR